MANITDLTALGKTSVTANDFFLTANSARGDNKKFGVSNLFPTLQSKSGVTGIALFVDVTDKNVINLKGIKSASSILTISTTAANDISLDIAESQINLANCSNSSSGFLSTVALASNVSGTLPVANGGTNATSFADKAVIITQDSGDDTLAAVAMSTNGQLLIGGTSGPAVSTLTAGTNVTITNADGGITIASSLASVSSDLDMNNNDIDLGSGYLSSDGASNGVRVTANNAYIGASGSYFNSSLLNLSGGVDFASGASYAIQVAAGTSPGTLTLRGQTNSATNGGGGNTSIYAGTADGSGTGGTLGLYGGDSGSGTGGVVKIVTSIAGTETDALTVDGASDVTVNAGSLIITSATEGIVHTNSGTITQATNHTTGVTINATSGVVQLAAVGLAAATNAEFTITNSTVQADSVVLLTVQDENTTDNAQLTASTHTIGAGSFKVSIHNPAATGTTSSTASKIHFLIINNSI
tara:strand:- start:1007 stop:2416 length:1410 start_codon:yes stop_codon:yes gene_type:complete